MRFNPNQLKLLGVFILLIASVVILWKLPLNLGLDLQGGSRLVLQAEPTEKIKVTDDAVNGIVAVIRNRIDALGVTEPLIQRKGMTQVVVELPGISNPDRAIKVIGDTALLEFVEADWAPADERVLTPDKVKELYGAEARLDKVIDSTGNQRTSDKAIILRRTALTGADLKGAWPSVDQYGNPIVDIEFNAQGTTLFSDVTSRSVNKPIAIVLDKKIISAPNVREPIPSGKAQISGSFTAEEVQDLVIKLRAGSLPIPVKIVENRIVGPTLGKDSVDKSTFAGIIGFIIVVIFMVAYYRLPGLLADIALVIYSLLVLAILAGLHTTLTLPGIAGFLLSIGMAVDANIIIFERLKEELRLKKPLRTAIDTSFHRAFAAILDSNITTIIAALTLFWLGTGTIRGFAVTLTVGIIASMLTALVITRLFLELMVEWKIIKSGESTLLYK